MDLDAIQPALSFFDSVQTGVTLLDDQLELVWSNRYFREELQDLPGLCGKHCFAGFVPPERRCEDCLPPLVQRSGRAAETLRSSENEDGSLSYFRVLVSPFGPDEKALVTLIMPLPADDLGRLEGWRERFLLSAIRYSNDAIFALDRTQTVRFWNRGAETIFGWRIADIVGEPIHRLFGGTMSETLADVFSPSDQLIALANREIRVPLILGGEIWIEVSRTPLLDGSGRPNGYSFVVRDINERKIAEEKMAFTERMTAVGNMAAALAHEIGTPLGVISGNAEYLMLDLEEDDERREELESIVRETDRIGGLVRELLNFSRPEAPEMELIQVEEILERVQRLIHHASEKQGTTAELQIDDTLPAIVGDANQLEQVILNLAMNALQAVESGGDILMLARNSCPIGPDGIEHSGVELVVQDTGPGFTEETRARIFNPFFTTKANGTGLGLSVCKSLVERHGGTISARSLPTGGAGFTVWLPVNGQVASELV